MTVQARLRVFCWVLWLCVVAPMVALWWVL